MAPVRSLGPSNGSSRVQRPSIIIIIALSMISFRGHRDEGRDGSGSKQVTACWDGIAAPLYRR